MPLNTYLISFPTDHTVSTDDRLALKEWYAQITRVSLNIDAPINIDHLDADEPTVRALLAPS